MDEEHSGFPSPDHQAKQEYQNKRRNDFERKNDFARSNERVDNRRIEFDKSADHSHSDLLVTNDTEIETLKATILSMQAQHLSM